MEFAVADNPKDLTTVNSKISAARNFLLRKNSNNRNSLFLLNAEREKVWFAMIVVAHVLVKEQKQVILKQPPKALLQQNQQQKAQLQNLPMKARRQQNQQTLKVPEQLAQLSQATLL